MTDKLIHNGIDAAIPEYVSIYKPLADLAQKYKEVVAHDPAKALLVWHDFTVMQRAFQAGIEFAEMGLKA